MKPKRILAVMAHQTAQISCDLFLPRWRVLDVPIVAYLPEGHTIKGFDAYRNVGINGILGWSILNRYLQTCIALLEEDFDEYTLIEYDTVNLGDQLPECLPGGVTSNMVFARPHEKHDGPECEVLSFSPWTFDRKSLAAFVEKATEMLQADPEGSERKGILDRWVGLVIERAGLEHHPILSGIGWPKHPGAHELIERMGINWVHGWKLRCEFGDLWKW